MVLSLTMLGDFALRDGDGAALTLPTRKTRALLAFLALNADKPQRRERLMSLLWSDRGEQQARQSLNQALRAIRKLGEEQRLALLESDGERVILRGAAVASDIARFQSLLDDDPEAAAALYTGDFLDGLSVADPAFETWLTTARAELRVLACRTLERAAVAAHASDNHDVAVGHATRVVALDPLREEAHRLLMRLLHESGDRAAALRQYQACVDILAQELGIAPDAATKALYKEIRRADAPARPEPSPVQAESPSVPDKPTIAVLPFANLSGDPTVDHLADGLMDDLIMALAKVRNLVVIGRHSTAVYKEKAVSSQAIAQELGVRYVLEGSLRTSGDRLRCTGLLVDSTHGHHVWSGRYDCPLEDLFALQDDIVRQILVELQVRLTDGDSARIASRGTRNLEAWLLRVQGAAELARVTREGTIRAREFFTAAHEADPNWARPLAGIAGCYYYEGREGWCPSPKEAIATGIEYAEKAIAMDPKDPFAYVILRNIHTSLGNHDESLALCEKAVSVAPNDQLAVGNLAIQLMWMGEAERAAETFEQAARLGPQMLQTMERRRGLALHVAEQTERAIAVLEALARREPEWPAGLAELAAAYVSAGRLDAARATIGKVMAQERGYTTTRHLEFTFFRDPAKVAWLRDLLIEAGLPE